MHSLSIIWIWLKKGKAEKSREMTAKTKQKNVKTTKNKKDDGL